MRLYVDLETLKLIEAPGFRNPVTSLRFKRGDAAQLEVVFLQDGTTAVEIGDPGTLELQFGIKPRGRYDVGYLVHTADWTLPQQGAQDPSYLCSPSFNTVELDSAMQVGSPTGSELSEISLMGEITWREGTGEPTSTRTFTVVVENDVNRGTEGVPEEADPAYPLPGDIELVSHKGEAGGYAGLDGTGKVPATLLPSERPPGMVRLVSVSYSGTMYLDVKSSTGYAGVLWWDGSTAVAGTGDPNTDVSFSKIHSGTGPWADSAPKEVYLWPSTASGVKSGNLTSLNCDANHLTLLEVSGLAALTTIDFLLPAGSVSRWHQVDSDEVWHFYEGEPLELWILSPNLEDLGRHLLGPLDVGTCRREIVPAGWWQAARSTGAFSLVGCTVGPGFDFMDFRLAAATPGLVAELCRRHPTVEGLL